MSRRSDASVPTVSFLCDYLGISRQGYYRHVDSKKELDVLLTSIVLYCQHVRQEQLPRSGMRELYALCRSHFGEKMAIGRDQCFNLLRANGLVLRSMRKPRTTDSRHHYRIYPDLLNTSPKLVAGRCGELMVSDITYVATDSGWAYLSLVTDAYTRLIVGHALSRTLEADGPMGALEMAADFYASNGIALEGSVHHSDRGVQYCSASYVDKLKERHIRISMTQTGDPLHNAMAERMNNTVKNGWLFDSRGMSFGQVERSIAHAVDMYNSVRPHQALGMRTPMQMLEDEKRRRPGCLSPEDWLPPRTAPPSVFLGLQT